MSWLGLSYVCVWSGIVFFGVLLVWILGYSAGKNAGRAEALADLLNTQKSGTINTSHSRENTNNDEPTT